MEAPFKLNQTTVENALSRICLGEERDPQRISVVLSMVKSRALADTSELAGFALGSVADLSQAHHLNPHDEGSALFTSYRSGVALAQGATPDNPEDVPGELLALAQLQKDQSRRSRLRGPLEVWPRFLADDEDGGVLLSCLAAGLIALAGVAALTWPI